MCIEVKTMDSSDQPTKRLRNLLILLRNFWKGTIIPDTQSLLLLNEIQENELWKNMMNILDNLGFDSDARARIILIIQNIMP